MGAPSVLFIGGTGTISWACVRRAIADGLDVTVLNRGASALRPVPGGAHALRADVRDPRAVSAAIGKRTFDVVAQFLAFTPEHTAQDLDMFAGRCGQYIFISSASAYLKPPARLPITESTPLRNPYWQYSRDKIACEDMLLAAYRERGFPVTIVRPSHTYDGGLLPTIGGWTDIARMREGRPVIVHGDGTSIWTLTHADDFATGFVSLLGRPQAIGEAFHITGTELLTWNEIYRELARAGGWEARLVHVASETIGKAAPSLADGLLGDKSHSLIFDNAKIRMFAPLLATTIPFARGAEQIIEFHEAHPELHVVDPQLDRAFDQLAAAAQSRGSDEGVTGL